MRFNGISIMPVRSLEVGDLIAHEFLGSIVSGRITGIVHYVYQLTEEQREYMLKNRLEIPDDEYGLLAGPNSCLIFGTFKGPRHAGEPDHMFVQLDVNFAVFETSRSEPSSVMRHLEESQRNREDKIDVTPSSL